jgi:hypothetical protein
MDSEEVKKYFKDLLECPVCFETIDSVPIYQCRNGHVVCKNCHPKLETCPICRELRDGPIRCLKLEEMVERLQLSMSEATKKLSSESTLIDPIVPETPNVNRNAYQETRQATVELNIVEDDENVTSEPRSANCLNLLTRIFLCFIVLVGCFLIGGYILLICYLFSLQTTASQIFGLILLVVIFSLLSSICITFCFEVKL